MSLRVTRVDFAPAPPLDQLAGLLGYAKVEFNEAITIYSVAVRRARAGHLVLSFPVRGGRPVATPIDSTAHTAIESEVIAELQRQGRLAS